MPNLPPESDLNEVRRAAFELRGRDPAEAVRVLRRLVRKGGDIEPLAQGALGEILLEDFGDYDAAIHHFQRLLDLAPEIAAGALGLARARARNGEPQAAQEAYVQAVASLEALARAAKDGQGEDTAGADEAVLTALEAAVEERELCREQMLGAPHTRPAAELLDWAESERLFDDPEGPDDLDDWIRFAQLRGVLAAFDGHADIGLALIERIGTQFSPVVKAHLRSLIHEAAGDFSRAADEALQSFEDDPDERLRCAALLVEAGRRDEARRVLEALRQSKAVAELPKEFREELLSRVNGHLEELGTGGLVTLGLKGRP